MLLVDCIHLLKMFLVDCIHLLKMFLMDCMHLLVYLKSLWSYVNLYNNGSRLISGVIYYLHRPVCSCSYVVFLIFTVLFYFIIYGIYFLMSASSDRLGLFSELIFGGHRIYGNKER